MAPWNQPKPLHFSWKQILQMERERAANKAVEKMMNQVKDLLHESAEDQALIDEEVLEEHAYEQIFQEYPDEAYHVEDSEEAFNEDEVLSLNDPDEDIQVVIPPTHKE
jgi:arylsulfatase A-like enzyme